MRCRRACVALRSGPPVPTGKIETADATLQARMTIKRPRETPVLRAGTATLPLVGQPCTTRYPTTKGPRLHLARRTAALRAAAQDVRRSVQPGPAAARCGSFIIPARRAARSALRFIWRCDRAGLLGGRFCPRRAGGDNAARKNWRYLGHHGRRSPNRPGRAAISQRLPMPERGSYCTPSLGDNVFGNHG